MMALGIPPLLNKVSQASSVVALVVADAKIVLGLFNRKSWGIYLNGKPAFKVDSVVGIDFKADYRIAEYPMEAGAFQSYNKVTTPRDIRVKITRGGTDADRKELMAALEVAAASLGLYDIYMPEGAFKGFNIAHFDWRRTAANGAGLLTVDVWLTEVRVTATAAFSNTAAPSGAAVVNGGMVQPATPTAAQVARAAGAR